MSMISAEIDELRQQLADATESMGRVEERCAKLRELVRDAWGSGHPDRSCGDCEIRDFCAWCVRREDA